MAELIRCQRLNVQKFAAIGLLFVLLPAVVGGGILAAFPPGVMPWTAATFCFILAFFFAYPTLRMFHWIETDGRVIRGKRFWTRLTIKRPVSHLIELRGTLGQFAERGRDPALGAIHPYNYQLLFRDRHYAYLSCTDMTNTEAFAQKIITEPNTGLSLPVTLAGTKLGRYTNYESQAMGRSYGYYGQGHLIVTIYVYACEDGVLVDGIDSPRLIKEFEDSISVAVDMDDNTQGDMQQADPHPIKRPIRESLKLEKRNVTLGEHEGAWPARCGIFEVEIDDDLVESRLYLTVWRNHFIKMRCTMPANYRNSWGPTLSRLEDELGRLLV